MADQWSAGTRPAGDLRHFQFVARAGRRRHRGASSWRQRLDLSGWPRRAPSWASANRSVIGIVARLLEGP